VSIMRRACAATVIINMGATKNHGIVPMISSTLTACARTVTSTPTIASAGNNVQMASRSQFPMMALVNSRWKIYDLHPYN